MTDLDKAWREFKSALFDALKIPRLVDWLANEIGSIGTFDEMIDDEEFEWVTMTFTTTYKNKGERN